MKRLLFNQTKDKKKIYTNEILCGRDLYRGEIMLGIKTIEWYVYGSFEIVIDKGVSASVPDAQKAIKSVMINHGASFDREHRKFKI